MQKISTCLWFDGQAEEAANFYVSVFKNSRIVSTLYWPEGMQKPDGAVLAVDFVLDGVEFSALNAGPAFKFNPAISLVAHCDDQAEVDRLWDALGADGGMPNQCSWITDKYGVSWQVVPDIAFTLFNSPDRAAAARAFTAMTQMIKLDIATLQRAFDNA